MPIRSHHRIFNTVPPQCDLHINTPKLLSNPGITQEFGTGSRLPKLSRCLQIHLILNYVLSRHKKNALKETTSGMMSINYNTFCVSSDCCIPEAQANCLMLICGSTLTLHYILIDVAFCGCLWGYERD